MIVSKAIARKEGAAWAVRCPECGERFELEECPAPGGMTTNIVFCPECGIDIKIIPPKRD